MAVSSVVSVTDVSQVGQARRAAIKLAEQARFSAERCGQVALIVTELGNNLVKYATNGRVMLDVAERGGQMHVQMLAIDSGPGIADVQRSLQDGVSTGGTPGTGLGAVRRLAHAFDIHSAPGRGTVVFASCMADPRRDGAASSFEWAAVSTPAPGETACGDTWRLCERDGSLGAMVVDGLGQGPLAAVPADRAAETFDADPFAPPAAFCERAHRALQGSRGAALAAAVVSPTGRLVYAGVGNISGTIVADGKGRGLASQNGIVGVQMRRMQEPEYEMPPRSVLVMHSDGLSNRWETDRYPGLFGRPAAIIAGVLYRDYVRGRDDASIVVVKRGAAR